MKDISLTTCGNMFEIEIDTPSFDEMGGDPSDPHLSNSSKEQSKTESDGVISMMDVIEQLVEISCNGDTEVSDLNNSVSSLQLMNSGNEMPSLSQPSRTDDCPTNSKFKVSEIEFPSDTSQTVTTPTSGFALGDSWAPRFPITDGQQELSDTYHHHSTTITTPTTITITPIANATTTTTTTNNNNNSSITTDSATTTNTNNISSYKYVNSSDNNTDVDSVYKYALSLYTDLNDTAEHNSLNAITNITYNSQKCNTTNENIISTQSMTFTEASSSFTIDTTGFHSISSHESHPVSPLSRNDNNNSATNMLPQQMANTEYTSHEAEHLFISEQLNKFDKEIFGVTIVREVLPSSVVLKEASTTAQLQNFVHSSTKNDISEIETTDLIAVSSLDTNDFAQTVTNAHACQPSNYGQNNYFCENLKHSHSHSYTNYQLDSNAIMPPFSVHVTSSTPLTDSLNNSKTFSFDETSVIDSSRYSMHGKAARSETITTPSSTDDQNQLNLFECAPSPWMDLLTSSICDVSFEENSNVQIHQPTIDGLENNALNVNNLLVDRLPICDNTNQIDLEHTGHQDSMVITLSNNNGSICNVPSINSDQTANPSHTQRDTNEMMKACSMSPSVSYPHLEEFEHASNDTFQYTSTLQRQQLLSHVESNNQQISKGSSSAPMRFTSISSSISFEENNDAEKESSLESLLLPLSNSSKTQSFDSFTSPSPHGAFRGSNSQTSSNSPDVNESTFSYSFTSMRERGAEWFADEKSDEKVELSKLPTCLESTSSSPVNGYLVSSRNNRHELVHRMKQGGHGGYVKMDRGNSCKAVRQRQQHKRKDAPISSDDASITFAKSPRVSEESDCNGSKSDPDVESLTNMKKEKNRLAAQKCRSKQDVRMKTLKQQVESLEAKQGRIKTEIETLQQESEDLKNMLKFHLPTCNMNKRN